MLEYDRIEGIDRNLKELTLISAKIHQENVVYISIIILLLKILIIKDIYAMDVMIYLQKQEACKI